MLPTVPKIEGTGRVKSPVGNERGAALIMAIIMLVILSVLGSVVLMSSDSEMKVSGNYQVAKQTFWVADRAVEYATSRDMLMSMSMGTEVDLVTDDAGVHKARIEAAGGGVLTEGRIRDLGAGDLPAALAGAYGSDFGANYYQVSTKAQQTADANSAAVRIETTIVRIFKNDDESIFITTGGG
jgi:Tfp pilus assembly protein PilX